ncbi:unnamed protein product [Brassica oleracea var. botrytis]
MPNLVLDFAGDGTPWAMAVPPGLNLLRRGLLTPPEKGWSGMRFLRLVRWRRYSWSRGD